MSTWVDADILLILLVLMIVAYDFFWRPPK